MQATSKSWSDLITVHTTPADGRLMIQSNCTVPGAEEQIPATENQIRALDAFFQIDFKNFTQCQAHKMLSVREFSRISARSAAKKYDPKAQEIFAHCIASFILADASFVEFCVNWNDKNFKNGTASPRVTGAPIYADVCDFVEYVELNLLAWGWTAENLK